MKVTIDSSEPLSDVLRVVGSLYRVTLTTTESGSDIAVPAEAHTAGRRRSRRGGAAGQTAPNARGRSHRGTTKSRIDPKVIRQWAWENGHDVNARGSLPASVREAYTAANPS